MTRRLLPIAAALAMVAAPALAQTTIDAAVAISEQGYYLGPGTEISDDVVSDLVSQARNSGLRLSIAVLDESPGGGPTTYAGAVLDAIGAPGTVIVLTEDGFIGYETEGELERAQVEAALDAADAAGGSDSAYLSNLVGSLTGDVTAPPAGGGGGGGGGLWILLIVIAGGVLVVWLAMRRSRKAATARAARDISSARAEIQAQLDSMANDILDLSDRVGLGGAQAQEHFDAGSSVYEAASNEFEKATTLAQLEALAERIDAAAWELDAAQAILDGEPVPPKPAKEMARCFFDPTHRGPMVEAVIKTSAGEKEVRVCRTDAHKLEAGQKPSPRMIDVGGRRVPAPSAPRSHGGGGLGGMDLLSILVGGASQALPDLLGGRRARRGGGLFGGAPSRGSARTSSPSRRTTTAAKRPTRSRGGRRRKR